MSQETDALLRAILFNALLANGNAKQIVHSIKAMCNKDMIAAVEKELEELAKENEQG